MASNQAVYQSEGLLAGLSFLMATTKFLTEKSLAAVCLRTSAGSAYTGIDISTGQGEP
jgi:cobyric acid synthase